MKLGTKRLQLRVIVHITLQVGNEVNLILYRNVLRVMVCLQDPNIPTSTNIVGIVARVFIFVDRT